MTIWQDPKGEIEVKKSSIYRDIGFYIIAALFTIGIAIRSKIEIWSSECLLVIYIGLVATVLIQDKMESKEKKEGNSLEDAESKPIEQPIVEPKEEKPKSEALCIFFIS